MVRTFAAIDVGSFELELGIFEISDSEGVRSIDHVRHVIALGKDTFNDGKISYGLVEEMCGVLMDFVRIMKEYQVQDYRAFATTAMREARNSQIVLDQIRVRTGIEVRIISNSEQRFISFKAVASRDAEFQKSIQKGTAIVDVGFGSMQLSLFDKEALLSTQNLPLGVLRLRELLSRVKVMPEVEQTLVTEMVDNELTTFRKMYLKDREITNLIAIGEPVLTFYYHMDPSRRGSKITREELDKAYRELRRMTLDQIEETYDVSAEYAAMLFPTAAIVLRVMELTGAESLRLPGIRMLDGIAADYAEEKKLLKLNHSFTNDIIVTSRSMAKRYKCHMPHVQTVETAALRIFDCLKKYHGLRDRERLLLQIAADLHSCGKFVTMRDSTDCAYNIIMGTEIIGLSHLEREIVANVVRYHVKPFRYNEVFIEAKPAVNGRLVNPGNPTLLVAKLIAILRLANSMDRSHKGKLETCRLKLQDKKLVITTDYEGDVTLEAMSIDEKGDFFEEIFGIRPVLKQKKKV